MNSTAAATAVNSTEPSLWKFAILLNGVLVFFMQTGFVALEVGQGHAKNVRNILLKNVVDIMLSSLCWWACGYAFAYGETAGGIIGHTRFFYDSGTDLSNVRPWFFGWTFMLCCVTIVSGCLAERTHLIAYPVYTVAMSTFIHPLVAHWTWTERSWLNKVVPGYFYLDFAGGTSVHLLGGAVGLVGAVLCGPRIGRFEEGGQAKPSFEQDMTFSTIGTFMLWFGWYGFNTGSTYLYAGDAVRRVALNTTLTGSTAGLVSMLLVNFLTGTFDLMYLCNGLMSGLVIASSTSGFIHSWAAFTLGIISGLGYVINSRLMVRLRVDDPLDSAAVHGGNGLLGTLLLGVFADPKYVDQLLGPKHRSGGVLYTVHGWKQLGLQLLGCTASLALAVSVSYIVFTSLSRLGRLRVEQTTELAGIDMVDHLGPDFSHITQLSSLYRPTRTATRDIRQ